MQRKLNVLLALAAGVMLIGGTSGCGSGSATTTVVRSGTVSWENETGAPARYELEDGSILVLSPKGKVTQDINFKHGKRELTLDGEALLTIPRPGGIRLSFIPGICISSCWPPPKCISMPTLPMQGNRPIC